MHGGRLRDWLLRLGGLSAATWAIGSWPLDWVCTNVQGESDQTNAKIQRARHALDRATEPATHH